MMLELVKEHCSDHPDFDAAVDFLAIWNEYCHWVDDVVDGDTKSTRAEVFVLGMMKSSAVYMHPYFRKYQSDLYPLIVDAANAYLDSVIFEEERKDNWKNAFGDVLRTAGNNLYIRIVGLLSNWEVSRKISPMIREASYNQHHTTEGKAI